MISRIPTPNASVDASQWPLVHVKLTGTPSDDEYRVTLGRLRFLRSRRTPHVVVIDARHLAAAPADPSDARIARFFNESATFASQGPREVVVVAASRAVRDAFETLLRAELGAAARPVVGDLQTAVERALSVLRRA